MTVTKPVFVTFMQMWYTLIRHHEIFIVFEGMFFTLVKAAF